MAPLTPLNLFKRYLSMNIPQQPAENIRSIPSAHRRHYSAPSLTMLKLVLFSDLHLDAPFAWLGANREAARQRRQALRDTLGRIAELARREQASALLCAGDLFEQERVSEDTTQFLRSTFAALQPIPVFLAPGNHDWYGPRSPYHLVDWTSNVHVFSENRLEPVALDDGLTLWGAGHRAPANTDGFLNEFHVDRSGVHLGLFHGSLQWAGAPREEGKIPHAPFTLDQVRDSGLHHAFVGHFHTPSSSQFHTYPGNPDPLTFGETGQRGAVVATVNPDGSVQRESHRVAVTSCHDLTLDVTGCSSLQQVREALIELLRGRQGLARVTVQGELAPEVDLQVSNLQRVPMELDGLLVRIGDLRVAYDLETIAREETVRGRFVRDVQVAEMPEADRRRVLVTGLRALAGREDLEVA